MNIALLTYSTKPRGGVVHTLALAEALAARGHRVDVWSLARGGDGGFFRPVLPSVGVRLVPFADAPDEGVGPRILRSIALVRFALGPPGLRSFRVSVTMAHHTPRHGHDRCHPELGEAATA